jgi:hypothetical protein
MFKRICAEVGAGSKRESDVEQVGFFLCLLLLPGPNQIFLECRVSLDGQH